MAFFICQRCILFEKIVASGPRRLLQKILQLNSMQSITSEEIADGATYLSVMEDNLNVLKEALN